MRSSLRGSFGRKRQSAFLLAALLFLGLSGCFSTSLRNLPHRLSRVPWEGAQGFWEDEQQADYLISIDDWRVVVSFQGQVRKVATILDFSERRLHLCEDGQESTREIVWDRHQLTIRDPKTDETHHLVKLLNKPRELTLSPLQIPEPSPVTAERALQIEEELSKRVRTDQESQRSLFEQTWGIAATQSSRIAGQALPDELATLNMIAVKAENTKFLKNLVTEIGWIDSRRFGSAAAHDAFLLAQHSQDLPLMLAGLPKIKAEVETRRLEGETYALLYDRILLLLGEKQRYGTRMGKDPAGQPIILPTESPETVENRRKGLGMSPLAEYVKIFGTSEVRFSSACTNITRRQ